MSKIKMQIEAVSSLNVQALAMIILAIHPDSNYESSLKLPIKVGSGDAIMLCNQLGKQSMRPTTHTLMTRIIEEMGATVESVCISKVEGSLFFADITLSDINDETYIIDARPSDALSLAASTHCPIYCEEEVLLSAGMPDFRDIKDTMECDRALSDLVDQDLTNDSFIFNTSNDNDIEGTVSEKIDFLNKLNEIGLKDSDIEIIESFDDNFEDDDDNDSLHHDHKDI